MGLRKKKGTTIWFAGLTMVFGMLLLGMGCSDNDSGDTCSDECIAHTTICVGDAVQTCGDYDDDSCLEYGDQTACLPSQSCSLGACTNVDQCTDDCTLGTPVCVGDAVASCGEFDSDTCADLGTFTPCASGETCSNGVCSESCTDECTDGATECLNSVTERVCGDFDSDTCSDWGQPTACADNEVCIEDSVGGSCQTTPCTSATETSDVYYCSLQWTCPVDETYGVHCYEGQMGDVWQCGAYDCVDCLPICEWTTTQTGLPACWEFTQHCTLPPPAP